MDFKKRRHANSCDIARCRTRSGLEMRMHPELGPIKVCKLNHSAAYDAEYPIDVEGETLDIAPADPASHEAVLATVEPVRVEAAGMLPAVQKITITTQAALDAASALLQDIKAKAKALETQRTAVTKPLLDAKRNVDLWFKPAREALSRVESALKAAIAGYVTEQERARLAALQAGDHEAGLAVEQPALPSGIQTRTTWKFRVVDASKIPAVYQSTPLWVLDMGGIQSIVSKQKSNCGIPGIEVYPDTGIAAAAKVAS